MMYFYKTYRRSATPSICGNSVSIMALLVEGEFCDILIYLSATLGFSKSARHV